MLPLRRHEHTARGLSREVFAAGIDYSPGAAAWDPSTRTGVDTSAPWPTDLSGGACPPTLRQLIVSVRERLGFGPLGRQLSQRAFDAAPDNAQRNAEDPLTSAQQVDDLIVGRAFEYRNPVAHQCDLGQVFHAPGSEMIDCGADLLQGNSRVDQPLDYLQDQDVAKAV